MNPEKLDEICGLIELQAKRQKVNSRVIRFLVIFFILISIPLLFYLAVYLSLNGIGPGLFSEAPPFVGIIILFLVYAAFFIVPFILCLPVILPLALSRKHVSRIVVFRKFNDDKCKRALSKLIRSVLAYYGHVFTLSDSKFKVRWYIRIPIFLGQFSLFHFRQRNINTASGLSKFRNSIRNYSWLNVNWLLSGSKVFAVKTTDQYWKDTATTLLETNDLIIFDVSYASSSLEWEITKTQSLGFESHIIAVASDEYENEANTWKKNFDLPGINEIPVFFYGKDGRLDMIEEFEQCVVGKLARSYSGEDVTEASRSYVLKRTLYISCAIFSLFLVCMFFMGPYIMPDFIGQYSPFPGQVVNAYKESRLNHPNDNKRNHENIRRNLYLTHPKG